MHSGSIVVRLMVPVAVMLALVCLLGVVSAVSRASLRDAYQGLQREQRLATELIEVRSLSRSLQRDALNLAIEPDARELATLNRKFAARSDEMRRRLRRLRTADMGQVAMSRSYFDTQARVLERLAGVSAAAARNKRAAALIVFRGQVRPDERAASRIADGLIVRQAAKVDALMERTHALEWREFVIRAFASVVLFLVAAAVTLLSIFRSVVRPLSDIERAIGAVAAGDTGGRTPHVDRRDEIGSIARAVDVFRTSVLEREALRAEGERVRVEEMTRALDAEQARRAVDERTSERNRTVAAGAERLEREVEAILAGLRSSAGQLTQSSSGLAQLSQAMTRGTEEVSAAVVRAAAGATDIAAAADQFMRTLDGANERTIRSARLSTDAAVEVKGLAVQMERVQADAATVGSVVDLIHEIARRTNLLALNATIEAARAGEAGRGFKVVAGEVKALAEQTARATDDIARQIADVQQAARHAGESLDRVGAVIGEMAGTADRVAASLAEQTASGHVISRNVTGAAGDLDVISGRLADVASSADGVDEVARRVRGDAQTLERSATAIDRALGRFFAELRAA